MANNGNIIMENKQPQAYQLYPQTFINIPSMQQYNNPYVNHLNNCPIPICLPNATFGQNLNPYITNPYQPQLPVPVYNYIPFNYNLQLNPNQNNIDTSCYSQLNQTSLQSRTRLRPISSQNRVIEISKIDDYSNSINRNNISDRITSANNCSKYVRGDYKPYTLKEYKELEKVGIMLGGLGPNIGTKEWEQKKNKMKKMEKYSNQVNSLAKTVKKKKETLDALIQKEKQLKIESSNRRKCLEYGKLVRPKSRTGNTIEYYESSLFKDLGIINEKQNGLIKDKLECRDKNPFNCELTKENKVKIKANRYNDNIEKEKNNMYCLNQEGNNCFTYCQENQNSDYDFEKICRERKNYKAKIESIKETLMR